MIKKDLLKQVKNAVQEIEADAEILLYGSRARGDSIDQSDWDFLVNLKNDNPKIPISMKI